MRRVEKQVFRVNDELAALAEEERRLLAELDEHRRLHDEARLDAIDGDADDRASYREIAPDAARFEKAVQKVRLRQAALLERRAKLLAKLD